VAALALRRFPINRPDALQHGLESSSLSSPHPTRAVRVEAVGKWTYHLRDIIIRTGTLN
jgi:hypothetical protein